MNELENRFTVEFWESDFDLHEEKVVIPEAASSGLFSRRHTAYRHIAGCLPPPVEFGRLAPGTNKGHTGVLTCERQTV